MEDGRRCHAIRVGVGERQAGIEYFVLERHEGCQLNGCERDDSDRSNQHADLIRLRSRIDRHLSRPIRHALQGRRRHRQATVRAERERMTRERQHRDFMIIELASRIS